jgi:hypothetical protein
MKEGRLDRQVLYYNIRNAGWLSTAAQLASGDFVRSV